MVRAIYDRVKTQTRRVVRGVEECPHGYDVVRGIEKRDGAVVLKLAGGATATCPYGKTGDRLWVRESFWADATTKKFLWYVSDVVRPNRVRDHCRLVPGIHMRRELCRLVLEITNVRVQRLQDISEDDAKAEGVSQHDLPTKTYQGWADHAHRQLYRDLWNSLNAKRGYVWNANPLVWVVEFRPA